MRNRCLILLLFFIFVLPSYTVAYNGDTEVYVTDTGSKYHMGKCGYLSKSKHSITLEDAVERGYTPCSRCHPPRLGSAPARKTPHTVVPDASADASVVSATGRSHASPHLVILCIVLGAAVVYLHGAERKTSQELSLLQAEKSQLMEQLKSDRSDTDPPP